MLDLEGEPLAGPPERVRNARSQRDPGGFGRELEQTTSNVGRGVGLRQEVSDPREDPERSGGLLNHPAGVDRPPESLRIRGERLDVDDLEASPSIAVDRRCWK